MIRTLMTLIFLTGLVGSLGEAKQPQDSPPATNDDYVLRTPKQVDQTRVINRGGQLTLMTFASLRNTCENFDGYQYQVAGDAIVIDSYVVIQRDRLCAELYRDNLRRDYHVDGLNPQSTYRILFRDETGDLVDFGTTTTL